MSVLINKRQIPKGYIVGVLRNGEDTRSLKFKRRVAHLYEGPFDDPGLPMCRHGWNSNGGVDYSIFRGVVSLGGVCDVCLRRAKAGKKGVPNKGHIAHQERCVAIVEKIAALTQQECHSVEIHAPNADHGGDSYAITVHRFELAYRFGGDNILECLGNAIKFFSNLDEKTARDVLAGSVYKK